MINTAIRTLSTVGMCAAFVTGCTGNVETAEATDTASFEALYDPTGGLALMEDTGNALDGVLVEGVELFVVIDGETIALQDVVLEEIAGGESFMLLAGAEELGNVHLIGTLNTADEGTVSCGGWAHYGCCGSGGAYKRRLCCGTWGCWFSWSCGGPC